MNDTGLGLGPAGEFTAENAAAVREILTKFPQPKPNPQSLKLAREFCAEAAYKLGAKERDDAIWLLICAVDNMLSAWQQ
jgi:hypothetical protein